MAFVHLRYAWAAAEVVCNGIQPSSNFQFSPLVRYVELLIRKTWWDYSTVSNALGAVEVPKTPWQPDRDVQDWAPGTEDPIL